MQVCFLGYEDASGCDPQWVRELVRQTLTGYQQNYEQVVVVCNLLAGTISRIVCEEAQVREMYTIGMTARPDIRRPREFLPVDRQIIVGRGHGDVNGNPDDILFGQINALVVFGDAHDAYATSAVAEAHSRHVPVVMHSLRG